MGWWLVFFFGFFFFFFWNNLRWGFYSIYEFGNLLKNTGMLDVSLSIGQLGICFPEGFDLSSASSYSPVQSSQWISWENVNFLCIVRVLFSSGLFGHFLDSRCSTKSSDWIMFETLNTEKKTPELHCLEIVSLSVSSEALSTKSLQEAQIFFLWAVLRCFLLLC